MAEQCFYLEEEEVIRNDVNMTDQIVAVRKTEVEKSKVLLVLKNLVNQLCFEQWVDLRANEYYIDVDFKCFETYILHTRFWYHINFRRTDESDSLSAVVVFANMNDYYEPNVLYIETFNAKRSGMMMSGEKTFTVHKMDFGLSLSSFFPTEDVNPINQTILDDIEMKLLFYCLEQRNIFVLFS